MITRFLVIIFITLSTYATCTLKNMRAQQKFKDRGSDYVVITNFQTSLIFRIHNKDVKTIISKSLNDKDYFFDIDVDSYLCEYLDSPSVHDAFYIDEVFNLRTSSTSFDSFLPCMNFGSIPLGFHLPRILEMEEIVSTLMEISPEKLEIFKFKLIKLISDLDPKTPQANTLLFPAFLFSHLAELSLKVLTQEQLVYIIQKISNGLSDLEVQFLESLVHQIDSISFNKTNKGLNIVLNTTNDTIEISPKDLPYEKDVIELLKDQFNYLKISNGASFNFTTNTQDKIVMKVSGIKGSGSVPVLGNIDFTPNKLTLERNKKTPAEARIEIEKGITFNYSVDIDY